MKLAFFSNSHTGYSTADRLRAPTLRTHRILKRALILLAAESFTRERLAVDLIAVPSFLTNRARAFDASDSIPGPPSLSQPRSTHR